MEMGFAVSNSCIKLSYWKQSNFQQAQRNLPDNEDANAASPSISHKFPMSVNVVISVDPKMSFMANFYEYNADEKKQDLCVNILYNGELTTSRIIKPRTLDANATVEFAGRRIDSNLEVPWIVLPYLQVFKTNKGKAKLTTFVDRWDHISQLLLEEADKWLDYGQYRSPMGQYLFELSQMPCPGLENLEAGAKAGFVDVRAALLLQTLGDFPQAHLLVSTLTLNTEEQVQGSN